MVAAPTLAYRDRRGRTLNLGPVIGQGGEAVIYEVTGQPDTVAKIYHATPADYAVKLTWMIGHPPASPGRQLDLAWPTDLVFGAAGNLEGFLMPRIRGGVPLLTVFNPRKRAQVIPNFDRRYRYRAARNLAATVQSVHDAGYIIGDLNESNALVTATALVVLLDTDSFQVRVPQGTTTRVFRSPVGKPEYTAPELQGLSFAAVDRALEHDRFALGVLVFQLLMEGNHPYRLLWKGSGEPPALEESIQNGWFPYAAAPAKVAPPPGAPALKSLDPRLAALLTRCFGKGSRHASRRPTAGEWYEALMAAETTLRPCAQGHYYPGHLKTCPDCEALARMTMPVPVKKQRWVRKTEPQAPAVARPPPPHPRNGRNVILPLGGHPRAAAPAPPRRKRMSRRRALVIVIALIWLWNTVLGDLGSSLDDSSVSPAATATASGWDLAPAALPTAPAMEWTE